jgi:hypothetical protein
MVFRSTIFGLAVSIAISATTAFAGEDELQLITGRIEGYVGSRVLDLDALTDQPDFGFEGGGVGSIVYRRSIAFLQVDVFGDWNDAESAAANIGVGGHLGVISSESGLLALTGAFNSYKLDGLEDFDQGRIGGEAELFVGPVTLGVSAGHSFPTSNGTDYEGEGSYARAIIRGYINDNLKIEGVGGMSKTFLLGADDAVSPVARILIEYRPASMPVGFFTRWEGFFIDDSLGVGEGSTHSAVAGVRYYLDGSPSLKVSDREYFRDACTFSPSLAGALGVRGC